MNRLPGEYHELYHYNINTLEIGQTTAVRQIDSKINLRTLQWAGGHQNLLMLGWWNRAWLRQSTRWDKIKIPKVGHEWSVWQVLDHANIQLAGPEPEFQPLSSQFGQALWQARKKNILLLSLLLFSCGYMRDRVHRTNKQLWRA